MKVSHRTVGIAVLIVVLAAIVTPGSWLARPPIPTTISADGAVGFDVCNAWEQIGVIYRLSALAWVATFIRLIVQSLRNRTVSRTTALVCLASFGIMEYHELWRIQHCYSTFGLGWFGVWVSTVALLCLHHVFQRSVHPEATVAAESL